MNHSTKEKLLTLALALAFMATMALIYSLYQDKSRDYVPIVAHPNITNQ